MTDSSPSAPPDESAPFAGARWAFVLGAGLIAGFSTVVIWASIDRGKRAGFERWEQVTAVEDRVYFSMPPQKRDAAEPAAKMGEKPLFLVNHDTIGIHDSDVRRVAKDSDTGLTIYEAADRGALPSKERAGAYLLKVSAGRYAVVKAR